MSGCDGLERENELLSAKLEEAHEVLRRLACYLGTGGYNDEHVDVLKFEKKILEGIDNLVNTAIGVKK